MSIKPRKCKCPDTYTKLDKDYPNAHSSCSGSFYIYTDDDVSDSFNDRSYDIYSDGMDDYIHTNQSENGPCICTFFLSSYRNSFSKRHLFFPSVPIFIRVDVNVHSQFAFFAFNMTRNCTGTLRGATPLYETSIFPSGVFPLQILTTHRPQNLFFAFGMSSRAPSLYYLIEPSVVIFSGHKVYRIALGGTTIVYGDPSTALSVSSALSHP